MATTTEDNLRLELPDELADDNTWGAILNTMASEIERAITGVEALAFVASDITLSVTGLAGEQARKAVMNCTSVGALSGNVNIIAPNEPKIYIVRNATTGAFTLGIKTATGSAVDVPQDDTLVVWCDGADNFRQINALVSGTVAQATNADQLGGVVAANYAQLAVKNSWTKPQIVDAVQASLTTGGTPDTYTPNADTESTIIIAQSEITVDDVQINNPTGTPKDGQIMVFIIEQHASTPVSVIWGTEYIFPDDANLDMTQTNSAVDAFSFMYSLNLDRWMALGAALNFPRS